MGSNDISVLHLVRANNGIEPLICFLTSYSRHPAGVKHDLVFILKGFENNIIPPEMETLLNQYAHQKIFLTDIGYDIGSYISAASLVQTKYLCFLNSFSEILENYWLEKFYKHLLSTGCGMVSATGTLESHYTDSLRSKKRLSPQYLMGWIYSLKLKKQFPPFPNPHLRTNGFCISRALFLDATHGYTINNKTDALLFESGKDGISRQIASKGLSLIVVGRNGQGYLPNEWAISGTFRQGGQVNLLIADNQTRIFIESESSRRAVLSQLAWGEIDNH